MTRSHSRRLPAPDRPALGRSATGATGLLVLAIVLTIALVPRLAAWLSDSPLVGAAATAAVLVPVIYLWFRTVQRSARRGAAIAAVAYAVLVAGALWLAGAFPG